MGMSTAAALRSPEAVLGDERIISADSHVIEPEDLWIKNLPPALKDKYPKFPARKSPGEKPGGWNPRARIGEMEIDGGWLMDHFGQDTFMWSNDYPHAASTWLDSRKVIAEELGHLPKDVLRKVVRENVIELYNLKIDGVNN
jgi:hypothetical protein